VASLKDSTGTRLSFAHQLSLSSFTRYIVHSWKLVTSVSSYGSFLLPFLLFQFRLSLNTCRTASTKLTYLTLVCMCKSRILSEGKRSSRSATYRLQIRINSNPCLCLTESSMISSTQCISKDKCSSLTRLEKNSMMNSSGLFATDTRSMSLEARETTALTPSSMCDQES